MTKPYHLTQEQASEIRRNTADPHQRIMHQPKTSFLVSEEWLQAFANAALDKVLGEPEIYMAKSLENGTYATHPRKSECELFLAQSKLKNDGKQATVLTLYAPKDMT